MDTRWFTENLNVLQALAETAVTLGAEIQAGSVVFPTTTDDVYRAAAVLETEMQNAKARIEELEAERARRQVATE